MSRRERGFTLVEVMITLVILMFAMTAVSVFFVGSRGKGGVLNIFKQQSRIAQSGMDSIVGLEILRKDLEHSGYGLPWNNLPGSYADAASGIVDDSGVAPRGIGSVNGGGLNGSDYLVVKAANVGDDDASRKWTTLLVGNVSRQWTTVPANAENLNNADRVIVLSPGNNGTNWRSLVVSGAWWTQYGNTGVGGFAPLSAEENRVIYGIDNNTDLRMPFNRADYSIDTASVPQRCAPNTGILVKRVVRHADGQLGTALPLLDCVAAMEVQYLLDTNGDGVLEGPVDDISTYTAQQVRDFVRRVQVSLLAHEGQYDAAYTHPTGSIAMGGAAINVDDAAFLGNGRKYRWKVYGLDVTPDNLRN